MTSMTGEILSGADFYLPQSSAKTKDTLTYVPLVNTPSTDSLALQKFFLLSILGAEHTIYITTPYFLPDESLCAALINKAKEGVDVRVLVPNNLNNSQPVYYASHYSYENLLAGGVKIYEYQPTFIHTKTMVIDGAWSVVGSANQDNRSRKINEEIVFGIADPTFAASMEDIFKDDMSHTTQIDLTEWQKRSLWQRVREIFDQKLIQQY